METMSEMMKIRSLHHASIMASDAVKAAQFYCGLLGLQPLPRPDGPIKGFWLQVGDAQVHIVEGKVETPPLTEHRKAMEGRGLAGHFALEVEDASAAGEFLTQAGYPPLGELLERPNGSKSVFVRDPDGNLVEFIQLPG
jgi:glyoxylase I family protein